MLLWTLLVEHVTVVTRLLFALSVIVIEVQVRVGGAGRGPLLPLLVSPPPPPEAAAADHRHQQRRARAGHRRGCRNLEIKYKLDFYHWPLAKSLKALTKILYNQ